MLLFHFNLKINIRRKSFPGRHDVTKMARFDVRTVCKQPRCQAVPDDSYLHLVVHMYKVSGQ
jgi:hypothetical protein